MTPQPLPDPQTEQPHDRQAALQQRLQSAFPPAFPRDADPEKTIQWIAANIDKGLCRIYAVHINECLDEDGHKRLLERVRRRIDDPQLIEALKEILTAPAQPDASTQESLAPLLADIALEGIDQILQQAKSLGREENFFHVQCLRVGNELIVLAGQDPRYDWIVPAVQKRLREELAKLHYDPESLESQSLDLTRGGQLRFLGYELRLVPKRHGEARVQYKPLDKTGGPRRPADAAGHWLRDRLPRLAWLRTLPGFRFVQHGLDYLNFRQRWRAFHGSCRQVLSIQLGWRHLPVALCPILVLLLGWRSPIAWICLLAAVVCNGLRILQTARSLARSGWRHKAGVAIGGCTVAATICLFLFLADLYSAYPHESSLPDQPPGFSLGRYPLPDKEEPAWYGLYVPPQLRRQSGPYPLLVFFHGRGERKKDTFLSTGLPEAIRKRLKQGKKIDFIAFFPHAPEGTWSERELDVAMEVLGHVVKEHPIDPDRIALTGHSSGAHALWTVAAWYPEKWSALVSLSSFDNPDIERVKHIPCWFFQGDSDHYIPVAQAQRYLEAYQKAGGEARLTIVPKGTHVIWPQVYGNDEVFTWLASKRRP